MSIALILSFRPRQANHISSGVVTTHFTVEKMDKLNDVFERMDKGQLQGRVVLDLSG
jgi:D-arabinose 1-dehydrogenase-like Zn-dependent alcohol dehydrogenase